MDNPIAMPNQRTRYVAQMICRACGYEPESAWAYYYEDLPLFCADCHEHALRPKLGLEGRRIDEASKDNHSA